MARQHTMNIQDMHTLVQFTQKLDLKKHAQYSAPIKIKPISFIRKVKC